MRLSKLFLGTTSMPSVSRVAEIMTIFLHTVCPVIVKTKRDGTTLPRLMPLALYMKC